MKKINVSNYKKLTLMLFAVMMLGCNNQQKQNNAPTPSKPVEKVVIYKSTFDENEAYNFVKKQTDFGPRVPGTEAHAKCAEYLENQLDNYCDSAFVQNFKVRAFDNTVIDGKNIIGVFNPEAVRRVLLCAHWDSRPFADHDPNPDNYFKHIDGANDGASGVGVLLEVARQLSMTKPEIGVDIIFFDVEDYGPDEKSKVNISGTTDHLWCLGSQHWARNPHDYDYKAMYGILLDMVGNTAPSFKKEQFSTYYAPRVVDNIWKLASDLNYGDYFVDEVGGIVTDDHLPLNEIANIPTINIIHQNFESPNGMFFEHWHTVKDNIDGIDPATLKIVGDVVLTTIMKE